MKKTKHKLLTEAIADAKTVKATALAQARATLDEAFTPHLKDMLSKKIAEMDDEDELEEREEITTETSDLALEESDEISIEELMAELEGEDAINEEDDVDEAAKKKDDDDEKPKAKPKTDDAKDKPKDDADEKPADDEGAEDDDEGAEGVDDEDIDLEDLSEDDLKNFITDVIATMVASGELEPGENAVEEPGEMGDEDTLDIDGLEGGEEDERGMGMEIPGGEEEELPTMEKQLFELKTQIKKLKSIKSIAAKLLKENKGLKLFNAKLLYTNKIYKGKNLKESQKVKVLKAFDKASTVKEAKIIYESLNMGIGEKPTHSRRNMNFASKSTPNPRRRQPLKENIINADPMVKYFRKIAFGEE